ncbi:hypothetical protein SS1G_09303 [Sclerotinia sclerotiorum 1980 UF-70]|uniref:Uncharacterized protein n=1 Tax=Sclerotinia sclerotiorum (strain ATCC 18683 / 1980 / Ss-1) TaxID=665079 RepID=A7EVE5_SCLS1|nr:hypothetical protein SS1G_09303 [Sclerotinia sclerotiorum 1980 UF-70]EDN93437.1 hypothetical protein SS1G_09303 [Sclerotinia sclerotiorum 1980 UF-70]
MSPETIQRNPTAVVLRGTSVHGPVELSIHIEKLPGESQTMHQLAVRKAMQDLEEAFVENNAEDIEKQEFQELDFVVISKRESPNSDSFATETSQQPRRHPPRVDLMTRPADNFRSSSDRSRSLFPASQGFENSRHKASGLFNPIVSSLLSVETSSGVNSTTGINRLEELVKGNQAPSNLKRSFQRFSDVPAQQPRRNHEAIPSAELVKRNKPISDSMNSDPLVTNTTSNVPSDFSFTVRIEEDWAAATSKQRVSRIIELQKIDGTWTSLSDLEPVLGFKVPHDVFNVQKDATAKKLWITFIVLGFLEHTMARGADVWKHGVVKTKMWLNSVGAQCVPEFKQMKKTAMEVVKKANQTTGEEAVTANELT